MAIPAVYVTPNALLAAGGLEGATDDVISATYWNRLAAIIRYLGGDVGYVGCRAYQTTTQSIPDSVATAVAMGGESFDSDPNGAMHDLVTNNTRITIRTSGIYIWTGHMVFSASGTGFRAMYFRVNGAGVFMNDARTAIQSGNHDICASTIYAHTAGDYVELMALHTAGVANVLVSGELACAKL